MSEPRVEQHSDHAPTSETADAVDSDHLSDDSIGDEELANFLVQDEEEEAYTYAEVEVMLEYLREEGVPRFMTWYLTPKSDGSIPSLTKLLYSLGQDLPEPLRDPRLEARYLHQYTHNILWRIVRDRERLPHLNSVEDALTLIRDSKNILVLSGAGISTSSGIPDFRSKGGLYSILREECHPQLDQPEDVFDIKVFQESPEIFYSVARKIFPGQIQPGPCHRWIKMLEEKGQLLRNYTQNIDNLEGQAGVKRVVQCHGSFATASCLRCRRRVPGSDLEPYISSCTVPFCPDCRKEKEEHLKELRSYKRAKLKAAGKGKAKATRWQDPDSSSSEDEWAGGPPGVMKPDITFFHENLKSEFQHHLADDRSKADLVIIIGTSLEVRPVSELTYYLPHSVPQILINAQPLKYHKPDICLLGDADSIVQYICHALEWPLPTSQHTNSPRLSHLPLSLPPEDVTFQCPVDMPWNHFMASKIALEERQKTLSPTDDISDTSVLEGSIKYEGFELYEDENDDEEEDEEDEYDLGPDGEEDGEWATEEEEGVIPVIPPELKAAWLARRAVAGEAQAVEREDDRPDRPDRKRSKTGE